MTIISNIIKNKDFRTNLSGFLEIMDKKKKIYIFCLKPPICSLIKKRFASSNYLVTCINPLLMRDALFESMKKNVDCVIIDTDIKQHIKDEIKKFFLNVPLICLPSLDTESQLEGERNVNGEGMKNISEPFRLSELTQTLDDIFLME